MEVSIVVVAFAILNGFVVWLFLRENDRRRRSEYRNKALSEILPNQLQAYERFTLYLERISPEEMAVREQANVSTAKDLYLAMLNSVRQEFEHNVAMQIYITSASWKRIVKAREEVVKALQTSMKQVHPNATPLEFSAEFIEHARNTCDFYVERAKEGLRKDIAGQLFEE